MKTMPVLLDTTCLEFGLQPRNQAGHSEVIKFLKVTHQVTAVLGKGAYIVLNPSEVLLLPANSANDQFLHYTFSENLLNGKGHCGTPGQGLSVMLSFQCLWESRGLCDEDRRPDASARGVDSHHPLITNHRIGPLTRPEASGRGVRPGHGTPSSLRLQAPPLPRPNASGLGVRPGSGDLQWQQGAPRSHGLRPCPCRTPLAEASSLGSGDPQLQRPCDLGLRFRPRQGTPSSWDCQLRPCPAPITGSTPTS
ncbi:hypothetical protein MDA_GLEAN10025764 [Myotis davidii]|uniref:Uncharacterized protein n=1 Tax=Myotis davidii TaxID=225400 RepID=L5LQV5_MYODS|nr:hypothetical protein MDA_GLEAN10025764 [Myotis davidii]